MPGEAVIWLGSVKILAQDVQKKLIAKGLKCFDAGKRIKAGEYMLKALQTPGSHTTDASLWVGILLGSSKTDYALSNDFILKALAEFEAAGVKKDRFWLHSAYIQLGFNCLALGRAEDAGKFYNLACEYGEGLTQKMTAFSSFLLSQVAILTPPAVLLKHFQKYVSIAAELSAKHPLPKGVLVRKDGVAGRKISVCYLSPDFHYHVMYAFYCALLRDYDRDNFQVTCVFIGQGRDGYTENIKGWVDKFIDGSGKSLYWAAKEIQKLQPDILVDLAGHSSGSGLPLLAYRLAPVQISGLGWMETTGCSYVDYLLTDKYVDPEGISYITEKPLYLRSLFCHGVRRDLPASTGAPCKRNNYVTFGVFNRTIKFTEEIVTAWLQIMQAVPNSVLLIKNMDLKVEKMRQIMLEDFMEKGFPEKRIFCENPTFAYMERYLEVDIALDTYPWTGGGTTFDALYMGVPVVTMYGERRSSRFGLSILSNAGLGELVTASPQEYVERAVALANDWDLLDVLHKNLRTMLVQSPAMDTEGYVADIEAQYRRVLSESR